MTIVNNQRLLSIIERIERLEADKAAIAADIKEGYAEATGNGLDAGILRKVVALRKKDREKRKEEDAILGLYLAAVGEL